MNENYEQASFLYDKYKLENLLRKVESIENEFSAYLMNFNFFEVKRQIQKKINDLKNIETVKDSICKHRKERKYHWPTGDYCIMLEDKIKHLESILESNSNDTR